MGMHKEGENAPIIPFTEGVGTEKEGKETKKKEKKKRSLLFLPAVTLLLASMGPIGISHALTKDRNW